MNFLSGSWFRSIGFGFFLTFTGICGTIAAEPAPGVVQVSLGLRGLAHDAAGGKLYGSSSVSNTVVEIDEDSGAVTRALIAGTKPSRLAIGSGRSLWIGLDGEGAVRRLDLNSFTPDDRIVIEPGATIRDLAASPTDPYMAAVVITATGKPDRVFVIKNALLLPESAPMTYVTIAGNSLIGPAQTGQALLRYDIGPNGPGNPVLNVGNIRMADVEVDGDLVYHPIGYVYRTSDFRRVANLPGPAIDNIVDGAIIAMNRERREFFYMTPNWFLNRIEPDTGRQTGLVYFPVSDGTAATADLVAWGTNRVAFHSSSTLYLLQTDKVFLPSDVVVTQTAIPSSVLFGSNVTFSATITNKGPGPALQVTITNILDPNSILQSYSSSVPSYLITAHENLLRIFVGVLQPGETASLEVTALPGTVGSLTNTVAVRSDNEGNPADNSKILGVPVLGSVNLPPDSDGFIHYAVSNKVMRYEPLSDRLFIYDGEHLWPAEAGTGHLFAPLTLKGGSGLAASSTGGVVYTGFVTNSGAAPVLIRVNAQTFQQETWTSAAVPGPATVYDIDVSPVNSNLVVISGAWGTYLYNNGVALPAGISRSGHGGFSANGEMFYFVDEANCALETYRAATNAAADGLTGLILDHSDAGVGCSDFISANGRLYFDNGIVFDPVAREKVTNTPALSPPLFIAPNKYGGMDVLVRSGGEWSIRSHRGENFELFSTTTVGVLANVPLGMIEAGEDRVAVRTGRDVIIIDLAAAQEQLRAGIVLRDGGSAFVRFGSVAGTKYRVEMTDVLPALQWSITQDNFAGNGSIIELPVQSAQSHSRFYRVVRVP